MTSTTWLLSSMSLDGVKASILLLVISGKLLRHQSQGTERNHQTLISIRHEMLLAHKLELKPGMIALDMGCGIGGPGRVMARFSEAKIIGLNNNDYQLGRAKALTAEQGLGHLCTYM